MLVEDLEGRQGLDISLCLQCKQPCEATSLFCHDCLSNLQGNASKHKYGRYSDTFISYADMPTASSKAVVSPLKENYDGTYDERFVEQISTHRIPAAQQPQKTSIPSAYAETVRLMEQTMQMLNDAARRIAAVESGERRHPRASRLSPLRDISSEIQRESTPLPTIAGSFKQQSSQHSSKSRVAQSANSSLPDLWPWLSDGEESEPDQWANRTDPLSARRFPGSAESTYFEEEEIRYARSGGIFGKFLSLPRSRMKRLRFVFTCLTVFAVLVLMIDTLLVSFAFFRPHHQVAVTDDLPTLTLYSSSSNNNVARYGEAVSMRLRHFSPSTHVYITHDVGELMKTSAGSLVALDASGATDITMTVASDWQPGFHSIQAEDITTRYTASATLQISNGGQSRPPRLRIDQTDLNFGGDIVGASTLRPITLTNDGGGAITWTASSNQPWLLLTPAQGTFSSKQTIEVAVERTDLAPKDYTGKITFSSNVGTTPESIQVEMTVKPIPPDAGPVLSIAPAVLSFITSDGGNNPADQQLMVSNLGSQPLSWSLISNTLTPPDGQLASSGTPGLSSNWLSVDHTSGTVVPNGNSVIHVSVQSQNLLPGAYMTTLLFKGDHGTLNSPQNIDVSLTVQPHCSLTLSTGGMSFTAVTNQGAPGNQALGVEATSSCPSNGINWHATTDQSWLTITPTTGQAKPMISTVITVGVNISDMKPGTYTGTISVLAPQSTQSVTVVLTIQPVPSPDAPVLAASPLVLNFSTTAGQPDPAPQAIVITNTGKSDLLWHSTATAFARPWFGASPTYGKVGPGQTQQITVTVSTNGLSPANYVGQVMVSGSDVNGVPASGSSQAIAVNLLVLPPCTLGQPSSSALSFSATQNSSDPAPQAVTFSASGNCGWPLNWKASLTNQVSWLHLPTNSGLLSTSDQSTTLSVAPTIAGLPPGTYSTQVSITATDSANMQAIGSPQMFSVTLTVIQPCRLQLSSVSMSFTMSQGQSKSQSVTVSDSSSCPHPVTWTAKADASGNGWLTISPSSGQDTGPGSAFSVTANAATLLPGTYNTTISVSATGSGGAIVQDSPTAITVTVNVTGATVTGTVNACAASVCTAPSPLPGATVTLTNANGSTSLSTTADVQGNFKFTNVPLDSYTIAATGTDNKGLRYKGNTPLAVSADASGLVLNATLSP